jgi:tetratricopeptide (TPR) repeat protein
MYTKLSAVVFCIASVLAFAQPASAATIVIGVNGSAQACYWAARGQDTTGLKICATALSEKLTPRDRAATLINRSALLIKALDYRGGLADCDESIRTYPSLGEAYLNRGVSLRELGELQASIEALNRGLEVGLNRPQLAYYDLAMAKEDLGDTKGAYHDYKTALQLEPDFALAAEQLRRFLVTSGA